MSNILTRDPPTAQELAAMYVMAGWIEKPSLAKMEKALSSNSEWFSVRNEKDELLGIGRFITDYSRYAFVVDVIVDEPHRAKGVGTAIMKAIIEECKRLDIDSINLWPSEGKVSFYEKFGFYAMPGSQPHMKLQKDW